jgi:hypothetical protein
MATLLIGGTSMTKRMLRVAAVVLVCLVGAGHVSEVMAASQAKKLSDLTCVAGQTVVFDGSFWACVDFPAGITGLQRVQADFDEFIDENNLSTVPTQEVAAQCPTGKKVVGGGQLFFWGGPTVPIRNSVPNLDLSAWVVDGTNVDNTPWRLSAVAICADA